jgi:hypothetical protein
MYEHSPASKPIDGAGGAGTRCVNCSSKMHSTMSSSITPLQIAMTRLRSYMVKGVSVDVVKFDATWMNRLTLQLLRIVGAV